MKTIIILAMLLTTIAISAQTVKNQSVNLEILGLQYNYEMPLSKATTVVFHGGLGGSLGYSSSSLSFYDEVIYEDDKWFYSLSGVIGADFRYYYNLAKRERNGKDTRKNSADFWAVDLQYVSPAIYEHNMHTKNTFMASPYWGLRRVYKNNWLFEFHLGLAFGSVGGEFDWGPTFNLKVGYSF